MKIRIAGVFVAAVLATACGAPASGARHPGAGSGPAGTATQTGTQAAGRPAGTPAAANASAAASAKVPGASSATASTQYPQYVQGTIPAKVTVSLGFTCVRQGTVQTITIHTTPGYYVAFDTQYADGKDGQKEGGMGYTVVPADGTWFQTWTVSPQAAGGKATVFLSVEGGHPVETAFRQPTFQVGSC